MMAVGKKVEELIALGDLSSLGREIGGQKDWGKIYTDDKYRADHDQECLAYARDRGEELHITEMTMEDFAECNEYNYAFYKGEWYVSSWNQDTGKTEMVRLHEVMLDKAGLKPVVFRDLVFPWYNNQSTFDYRHYFNGSICLTLTSITRSKEETPLTITKEASWKESMDEDLVIIDTAIDPGVIDWLVENYLGEVTDQTIEIDGKTYPIFKFDVGRLDKFRSKYHA